MEPMMYQQQTPDLYKVQGSYPNVSIPGGGMHGGALGEMSTTKKVMTALVVLGVLGGAAYWFYKSQLEGKASKPKPRVSEHKPTPRAPVSSRRLAEAKRVGAKAAKKISGGGKWFYAEGDKSVFYFKAPKGMPHPDEDYAEKIAPDGGMIWKVRAASAKMLAEDHDLPRVE